MEKDKFPASPCRKGIRVMAFPQIMRKPWSVEEVLQLRKLVKQNTPAQVIARKLGRSLSAVFVSKLLARGFL
jgi:hypothetical protein